MLEIKELQDEITAKKIGEFLTGPDAFDQTWAPSEKKNVEQAPIDSLRHENRKYWYIEDNGKIVGTMGVRENKYGSGGYEMDSDYFAIHTKYRNQGLASKLLKKLEQYVKNNKGRYIHVLSCDIDSYKAARNFYLKNEFKKVAEIPNYYVEGEGRVDFFKEL